MRAAERAWWLGLCVWLLVFVFWRPEPPPIYTQVPSVKKDPDGFRIFYDLVAKEAGSVSRTLRRPGLLDKVDVLVLLRPSEGLAKEDREDLMEWVRDKGGTLLVGYPIWDTKNELLNSVLLPEAHWNMSLWKDAEAKLHRVSYVPGEVESPRRVTSFTLKLRGKIELGDGSSQALAMSADGTVMASWDAYGTGQIVQLADSAILGNEAMGFKKTHLFAAALLDEIGRDGNWVFDESNEGVSIQPTLAPLLGAGAFRAVFLHLLLFFLFWYWYKSRRHTRLKKPLLERDVREVTTLANDIGRFYFGARKGSWALCRYLDFFKRRLQVANLAPGQRATAQKTVDEAQQALSGALSLDRQLHMIRKMAEHREVFRDSQRDNE
ncbi:MAG: DUF4350 domain-containing protein [Deltaproteobacteria bacterium]|nr:DUF4350 domain-containing protein [Deltaproteobacteria bacterium]